MTEQFDFKSYRELALDDSEDIYDESVPLSANLINLFEQGMVMPKQSIQLPILAAYALIPSAMASIVPIAFLQGDKGSGKSTATVLLSHLHNSEIQSAATTFAALRNHFNKLRWADPDYLEGEQNTILLWDNVNRQTLDNEQIYTLLLCGYNRKTDAISISAGSGSNQTFKVFGTKVLSSIHPFYASSKYDELNRRLIVFKFKQWEKFTAEDKEGLSPDFDLSNRLDFDSLNLEVLKEKFDEFWSIEQHLCGYAELKKRITRRNSAIKWPKVIDSHKRTISVDLLVTGVVSGVFESVEHGLSSLADYWEWYGENVASSHGATRKLLQSAVEELTATAVSANAIAGYELVPIEIEPREIKKRLNAAYQDGALEILPNAYNVSELMAELGFKLDKANNGRDIAWVPVR